MSESEIAQTTQLATGAGGVTVSFKEQEIMELNSDVNLPIDDIPASSSIETNAPEEQTLKEESPEVILSLDAELAKEMGSLSEMGLRASVETVADPELKKRISERKTAIGKMIDEKVFLHEQFRALTIEKFEKIEREKRKYKKEMKRLNRQRDKLPNNDAPSTLIQKNLSHEFDLKKASILTYDELFLLELESSSSVSTSSSDAEGDETDSKKVSFRDDFLECFEKLPGIDEISSETEHRDAIIDPELKGKFVNPLTGETDTSSSSTNMDDDDFHDSTYAGEEEKEEDSKDEDAVSVLELPDLLDELDARLRRRDRPEVNFLQSIALMPESERKSKKSLTSIEFKELRLDSFDVVEHFLENLFTSVVAAVEAVDKYAAQFDKSKLMNEMIEIWTTYKVEKYRNSVLNSKAVDHYRRQRKKWAFTPQPYHTELLDYYRYIETLNLLDSLREKAVAAKKKAMYVLDGVLAEMRSAQICCNVTSDKLEQRMRRTITPFDSKLLTQSLEADLNLMQDLRFQIAETRMELIVRNDTLARVLRRIMDYEHITDDLSMTRYVNAQQDVLKMGKLLESRTIAFDHVHDRCDNYIKRVAFYREKVDITAALLDEKKENLRELIATRDQLRARLMELHLEHSRCKAQKHELDLKAGILYSPYLMIDYDQCTELVQEKRKVVLELRRKVQKLGSRLSILSGQNHSVY